LIIIRKSASVSAIGHLKDDILINYLSDEHFLSKKHFNLNDYWVGSIREDSEEKINRFIALNKGFKRADRTVVLAAFVADLLINDCKYFNKTDICVSIGSSRGATGLWEDLYDKYKNNNEYKAELLTSPLTTLAHISTEVASYLNLSGFSVDNATTCSTAIQSIINGMAWLKSGMAKSVIAGAAEAPLTPFTLAQIEALKIYSRLENAAYPCMPLSTDGMDNNTFVLGEGAALFLMQDISASEVSDIENCVVIESVGYAYRRPPSLTGIDDEGTVLQKAMNMALKNQITDNPVDLILMHAPGTGKGDNAELNAIKSIFGDDVPDLYSNKWKIGHTYAASAALNIDLAMLCHRNKMHLKFPYTNSVINKDKTIKKIMINATGFGGNAASVIIAHPSIY